MCFRESIQCDLLQFPNLIEDIMPTATHLNAKASSTLFRAHAPICSTATNRQTYFRTQLANALSHQLVPNPSNSSAHRGPNSCGPRQPQPSSKKRPLHFSTANPTSHPQKKCRLDKSGNSPQTPEPDYHENQPSTLLGPSNLYGHNITPTITNTPVHEKAPVDAKQPKKRIGRNIISYPKSVGLCPQSQANRKHLVNRQSVQGTPKHPDKKHCSIITQLDKKKRKSERSGAHFDRLACSGDLQKYIASNNFQNYHPSLMNKTLDKRSHRSAPSIFQPAKHRNMARVPDDDQVHDNSEVTSLGPHILPNGSAGAPDYCPHPPSNVPPSHTERVGSHNCDASKSFQIHTPSTQNVDASGRNADAHVISLVDDSSVALKCQEGGIDRKTKEPCHTSRGKSKNPESLLQKRSKISNKCLFPRLAADVLPEGRVTAGDYFSILDCSDDDPDVVSFPPHAVGAGCSNKFGQTTSARSQSSGKVNIGKGRPSPRLRPSRLSIPKTEVIDLTSLDDDEQEHVISPCEDAAIDEALIQRIDKLHIADLVKDLDEEKVGKFIDPLGKEEEIVVNRLLTGKNDSEKVVTISGAGITLLRGDVKRLRGTSWLNDEVINAFVFLLNQRNKKIFGNSTCAPQGIPKTFVFNTFFYTRLSSNSTGYDYNGVRRWSTRAKVDILKYDLILVPVNLGNHHWVLGGIDLQKKSFLYLDSMRGHDKAHVSVCLRRWLQDELRDKHGDTIAEKMQLTKWKMLCNQYVVRRATASQKTRQEGTTGSAQVDLIRTPEQTDGGSCGVFTAKIADCLSLGVKVYFEQPDISLIRARMALDLARMCVPM